jgi:hypothetical protein
MDIMNNGMYKAVGRKCSIKFLSQTQLCRIHEVTKKYGIACFAHFLVVDQAPGRKLKIMNFGRIMVKVLTKEQLTPGLETGIGLGHYQQEISDRESTIMPYIENFRLCPD